MMMMMMMMPIIVKNDVRIKKVNGETQGMPTETFKCDELFRNQPNWHRQ